jgi:hypothetical protein
MTFHGPRHRPALAGFRITVALIGCCWLTGCGQNPAKRAARSAAAIPASTKGLSSAQITDEEVQAFAEKYADGIARGDFGVVSSVFDWNVLIDRTLEGVELSPKAQADVRSGMISTLQGKNALMGQIHQQVANGGSYRLLRIHEVEGRRRALFRLLPPGGGVNYHDMVLVKAADGQCHGIDMHIFLNGEFLSTTMKRTLLPVAASLNRSLIEKLTGQDQLYVKHQGDVLKMVQAAPENPVEALRLFHSLPQELQRDKSLLLVRLAAAQGAGNDDECQQTLTDFRRCHPDEACVDFLSIDYFVTRKEYADALAAIDAVIRVVGGDSMLDVMKANLLIEMDRVDEAHAVVLAAVDTEPDLVDAWWSLVSVDLKRKNFEQVLARLKQIDERFEITWSDLSQEPAYAEFARSPQYQQWLDYQAASKP